MTKTEIGKYYLFQSEDLVFSSTAIGRLMGAMEHFKADTASPLCHKTHGIKGIYMRNAVIEGYEHWTPWCFMIKKEALGLVSDENINPESLSALGLKHILVCNAIVNRKIR